MAVKGIIEPHIEEADVYAFRAMAIGKASADQQRRAMDWLGIEACRLMADPYSEVKAAGGDHDDVMFALGRRHVAILVREMNLPRVLEDARKLTTQRRGPETSKTPSLTERRTTRGKR